ncbi:Bifunctional protein GlmU [bacterium HR21]|nr:Bifunctional protein GlmU [bacterium HR21]
MREPAVAAVVLAAGKGKRIGHPHLPKALLPLDGRPLLDYVLSQLLHLSLQRVLVVVGFRGEQVVEYLREHFPAVESVWQAEQLGTGHAVWQTAPQLQGFPGDVLVLPADIPLVRAQSLEQLIRAHRTHGASVSVLTTRMPDPTGYGRIVRDPSGAFLRIVEERDASPEERALQEVNTGILLARAEWLYRLLPELRPENAQREYYLTDLVALCRHRGAPVWAELVPDWEQFQGVNTWEELERVAALLRQMRQGRRHTAEPQSCPSSRDA